jgi:glutamate-1-semialdehyde 2,1-aminomutase
VIASRSGVLAGGASSPVRAGGAVGGEPFVQNAGHGAYAVDESGREYIDYVMAYGPLLFGHAHPAFTQGLDAIAARGTVFGSNHAEEGRLAQRIGEHLPSMEALRFVNTGTEAMMSALRVARAFTGRDAVVRFAGNYHGHFDGALLDAGASAAANGTARAGIPRSVARETIVARYNDLADLDRLVAGRTDDVAVIAVEPIVANMGLVPPEPGFVTGVFERASSWGALVLFDEVITWLRLGLGGGQGLLGVQPDLAALGKIMGGGFPLAAFGGRAEVMSVLAPEGATFTGGTFSGNPFSIAMGHRTLDVIEADGTLYARLDSRAKSLASGLQSVFDRRNLGFTVRQLASMVDFKFRPGPAVRNFDEAREAGRARFAAYYWAMRERGVLLPPSPNELMFLSTEHGEAEIDRTVEACEDALAALGEGAT